MSDFVVKPIAQNSIRCEAANDKGRLKVRDVDWGLAVLPDRDMKIYFNRETNTILITEDELEERFTTVGNSPTGTYILINP